MTDKEVRKLKRRDLLELLLEVTVENEELSAAIRELRYTGPETQKNTIIVSADPESSSLEEAEEPNRKVSLKKSEDSTPEEPDLAETAAAAGAAAGLTAVLSDSDDWKAELTQWEERLRERESALSEAARLQDELLDSASASLESAMDAREQAAYEAKSLLSEAEEKSSSILKEATDRANAIEEEAKQKAESLINEAGEKAEALIAEAKQKAAAIEAEAAGTAEKLLQRAQSDSESFWADIQTELADSEEKGGRENG